MDTSILLERFEEIYGHINLRDPRYTADEHDHKAERSQQMRE